MGGCQNSLVMQNISRQMLLGVDFLHSLRLIHRDLKPSNALISSSGVVHCTYKNIVIDDGDKLYSVFLSVLLSPPHLLFSLLFIFFFRHVIHANHSYSYFFTFSPTLFSLPYLSSFLIPLYSYPISSFLIPHSSFLFSHSSFPISSLLYCLSQE